MVTLLHDRGGRRPAGAERASVEASFDEVADDLEELVWLSSDIVERVRARQRSLIRLHRALEGDSVDDLERHMRAVVFVCDEIRRAAGWCISARARRGRECGAGGVRPRPVINAGQWM
jgi:hypothetical protein